MAQAVPEAVPEAGGLPPGVPPAARVLEVRGLPPGTEQELLVLYLESRRRSGGGPVQSCQRLGALHFVTFESPRDAQNVLARGSHRLDGAELWVRPAPPWDPTRLLLGGLDPRAPPELLEPLLETLLGRPRGTFTLRLGPAPGWGLLHLQDPLTAQEFVVAAERAQRWAPAGTAVSLLRVPQTPSVLVRAEVPVLSRDLLELYFENRRSGGGRVRAVRLLPGGRAAIVTFQELATAERVLRRPHRLQDVVLELDPHYAFLETLERDETPSLETAAPPATAPPAPARSEPAQPVALRLVPVELPSAAFPRGDEGVEKDKAMAGLQQCQEQVATASVVPAQDEVPTPARDEVPVVVAQNEASVSAVQDEVVVPAEPGAVRYLQRHYQELLGSIPEVSLEPLEADDVAGFRVSGEPGRCQAAAEFLQSLLGTVSSQPVTLQFPGVARFLWDEGGQSLIRQLESRFQCVIDLDGVCWSPPEPQPELVDLLPPSCRWDPQHWHVPGDADDGGDEDADNSDSSDGFNSNIEEIKELLVALRPGDGDDEGEPAPWPRDEWDPGANALPMGDGELPRGNWGSREEEEEAAQMVLAVQRSMDSMRCQEEEEEQLARATALSLRSYRRQLEEEEEEADAGLRAALEASLEEALPAADAARVTVFSSFERDASAVPGELERALAGRLRDEVVVSERLQALPAACLALLQRRHAVRLSMRPGVATLHGFAQYTADASRDLAALLRQLPPPSREPPDTADAAACWVRWEPSGTAVPYAPEAAALLEQAWLSRERRLDLVRDGRPFTVNLVRMEEYDIGNASAVSISRSRPPTESGRQLLGPEVLGLEDEEVRLMPLAKDSEEFTDTVRHFYQTLEDQYGKIGVVGVQKLIHPLLYQQYRLKKASMEKACAGSTAVVERVLFHGTTETSSREICLHGFNRSFCGKNAALYGLGVYFAAAAAVSVRDRYSPRSADGTKYIFVAKVLTGEYTVGRPGLRAPPLREGAGGPPRRYDSVVDNPRHPGIFVIFNDTQAYPQYLITCRRHGGGDPPDPPCPP